MDDPFWKPAFSFTAKVAAEARASSRRYWFPGGVADRRFPVAGDMDRMWPLTPDPGELPPEPHTRRGKSQRR